jgi:hypothetical protein
MSYSNTFIVGWMSMMFGNDMFIPNHVGEEMMGGCQGDDEGCWVMPREKVGDIWVMEEMARLPR